MYFKLKSGHGGHWFSQSWSAKSLLQLRRFEMETVPSCFYFRLDFQHRWHKKSENNSIKGFPESAIMTPSVGGRIMSHGIDTELLNWSHAKSISLPHNSHTHFCPLDSWLYLELKKKSFTVSTGKVLRPQAATSGVSCSSPTISQNKKLLGLG